MQEESRRPDHTEGLLFREVSVDLNGGQLASEPHHQGGETLEQPTQGFGTIRETQVQRYVSYTLMITKETMKVIGRLCQGKASAGRVIVSRRVGMFPAKVPCPCHSGGWWERHFQLNLIVMEMRG